MKKILFVVVGIPACLMGQITDPVDLVIVSPATEMKFSEDLSLDFLEHKISLDEIKVAEINDLFNDVKVINSVDSDLLFYKNHNYDIDFKERYTLKINEKSDPKYCAKIGRAAPENNTLYSLGNT